MSSVNKESYSFTQLSLNNKVSALDSTLQLSLANFRELITELQSLHAECENYKTEFITQREKCESKNCSSSEVYKKVIETKDNIINLAASTATRLNETKNFSLLNELFKILCGEVNSLTPLKNSQEQINNKKSKSPVSTTSNKQYILTPKKEQNTSLEEVSFKDGSISEIEGTPGRTSPIIQSKKLKSSSSTSLSVNTDCREKKKCSDSWPTPEPKQVKLCYSIGKSGGRSRQSRLSFVAMKPSNIVDLTCSPEITKDPIFCPQVQMIIKKESSENDDTILPSPTSGPSNYSLSKISSKENKFKKPSLSRVKHELEEVNSPILQVLDNKPKEKTKVDELEDSINILQPNRYPKSPYKYSPRKQSKIKQSPLKLKKPPVKVSPMKNEPARMKIDSKSMKDNPALLKIELSLLKAEKAVEILKPLDDDVTHCEESMMILDQVNNIDVQKSPTKQPLGENKNLTNLSPTQNESMSLLRPESIINKPAIENNVKRKLLENVEPVYKEPTVRKKLEKMALPAWFCDECKAFFGDLYADEPEKIKAAIDRCSKHRGRNNPIRPKTPPGFWNPRWDVPEDTEEFNRRNDAA